MKKRIMAAVIVLLVTVQGVVPAYAAVKDYWDPDKAIEDQVCTDNAAEAETFAVSKAVYTYYTGADETDTYHYTYAFDAFGRELFTIRTDRSNYFGELSGIETIDLYSDNFKVVVHDWSDAASLEDRDIEVSVYQDNKLLIKNEQYYDWNEGDGSENVLSLEAPAKEVSVGYDDGQYGLADNGASYQYENGNLIKYSEADLERSFMYDKQGNLQSILNIDSDGNRFCQKYFNVYDGKRLIMQQVEIDGCLDFSVTYEYAKPETNALVGYWISENCKERTLLVFSANGYFCKAHLEEKFGIPMIDSFGTYSYDAQTSELTCSGNENFSNSKVDTDGACKVSDTELIYLDAQYRRAG